MQTKLQLKRLRDKAIAKLAAEVRSAAAKPVCAPIEEIGAAADAIIKWRYIAKTLIHTYKALGE